MPRKAGGMRRKRRTHKLPEAPEKEKDSVPRSFVFRRGAVPHGIRDLVPDLRSVLMPHTALRLRERRTNSIRDYVSVATQIGVTHFWILSATPRAPYLRLARVPQGPTLTFRIAEYSLCTDVRAIQRRPLALTDNDFKTPPLLVLNNFTSGGPHAALMAETLRHSFPPLDVRTAKLSSLRRVLLAHRNPDTGRVYLRHYALRVGAAGISRPVRKMVSKRRVPKLGRLADVAQLLQDEAPGVFSSDSEPEDAGATVQLTRATRPTGLSAGASRASIRLVETGPRLTLEPTKAQAGLCDGPVLFHALVQKSEAEAAEDRRRVEERNALKRKRREDQEANVQRKVEAKRAKKERHRRSIAARAAAEQRAAQEEGANSNGAQ